MKWTPRSMPESRRREAGLWLTLVFCGSVLACGLHSQEGPSLRVQADVYSLDRRTHSASSDFRVTFAARPGYGMNARLGHFLVEFATRQQGRTEFTVQDSWGYFSDNSDMRRGLVASETAPRSTVRFEVLVDRADYERLLRFVSGYQYADLNYDLLEANCVTFGATVAANLGLQTPRRTVSRVPGGWTRPATYVRQMALANGAVQQLGERGAAQHRMAGGLPSNDATLPGQLVGTRPHLPAIKRVDQTVRSSGGAYARLVVYSENCECDSGEPTPTYVGLYVRAPGALGPASLVLYRPYLVPGRANARDIYVNSALTASRGHWNLELASVITRDVERRGLRGERTVLQLQMFVDSLLAFTADGSPVAAIAVTPRQSDLSNRHYVALVHFDTLPDERRLRMGAAFERAGMALIRGRGDPWRGQFTVDPVGPYYLVGPFLSERDAEIESGNVRGVVSEILGRTDPGFFPSDVFIRDVTLTIDRRTRASWAGGERVPAPPSNTVRIPNFDDAVAAFRSDWITAVTERDADRFLTLFVDGHLHVNSYGTRSEYGTVYRDRASVWAAARNIFTCSVRAREQLRNATFDQPVAARDYRRYFRDPTALAGMTAVVNVSGLRCSFGADGNRGYDMTIQLGVIGGRLKVIDVFTMS